MAVKEIKTQADLYCLFKSALAKNPNFEGVSYSRQELEHRIGDSKKRADIVLFIKEEGKKAKPLMVIETKRSKEHETATDYNTVVVASGSELITVREGIVRGIWDKYSYKYHLGALQQAKEYAAAINAIFYAVCYADTLFVKSFVKDSGLFYHPVLFTEEFGLRLLGEVAQLYKKIKEIKERT